MRPELLHVVAVFANPIRWKNRLAVHKEFEQHMLDSGVRLTTVECAYGERPFELTDHEGRINRVHVRAKTLVWNKENLINIGISRLPMDWHYVAWVDADVFFRKRDWATEAVHALQQYDVIQPWSDAYDLGPQDEHLASYKSFCRQYAEGEPVFPTGNKFWTFDQGPYSYPHSGYAWAATRSAIEWTGGLLQTGALGAGDHHMALGLVGHASKSMPHGVTLDYAAHVMRWQERADFHIRRNIGFVWGTLEHRWHGRKADRKYINRWDIIVRNKFNPDIDLKRNWFGVLELAGNKPQLTRDVDNYFRQRNEDANTIS